MKLSADKEIVIDLDIEDVIEELSNELYLIQLLDMWPVSDEFTELALETFMKRKAENDCNNE